MTLLRTDLARLFVFLDGENPVFVNSVEVDGISESAGDVTLVYEPNQELAADFTEVGAFRTTKDRATTSLIVRSEIDDDNLLVETHKRRCSFDAQINMGVCLHVASIDQFRRKEVWEDAELTTRATSKLIGFDSSGVELVTETYGVSIKRRYTVVNPQYGNLFGLTCTDFGANAGSLVVPPARCCGKAPGSVAFVGSASGNGMIAVTTNFGKDWECLDTESASKLIAGAMWRKWAVFAGDLGYTYFVNLSSPDFSDRTRCASPILAGFLSDGVQAVGISNSPTVGKIYRLLSESGYATTAAYTNPVALTNLGDAKRDQGFATLDVANCIVWSKDGKVWNRSAVYASPSISTPAGLAIRGPGQWQISASDYFYYTSDYGVTWTTGPALTYPGPLCSATRHVLSSAGWDATNDIVRVFRTTDGNASWYEEPNLPGAGLLADALVPSRIATAPENPNIIWIAGASSNGPCVILGRR